VQPLLRALELEDVAEEAQGVVVRDAEQIDLCQLDDVLEDVDALDDDDGDEQRYERSIE
jgi:hypothetical protein